MDRVSWLAGGGSGSRTRIASRVSDERGSAVIEAVIGVPAFMLFVGLIIFAGRMTIAHQAVESAANEAARSASIARSESDARNDATTSARTSLTNQTANCRSIAVSVNTADFDRPVGTPGSVSATVTCQVDLADVSIPGVPGTRTVTATMSSPLDTFRERS